MNEIYEGGYLLFLLVFTRISGAIFLNPFLGRKNAPAVTKAGLSLAVAICVMPTLAAAESEITLSAVFIFAVAKELLVGYAVGFIMQLVTSQVYLAGESIDMQLGIGMSKVYDPSSNISAALSATLYNLLFSALFFITGGHLTMIQLVVDSCKLFPVGSGLINPQAGSAIVLIFGNVLLLSLKIAMPVLATEYLLEAGFGFLMRQVSHINIFSSGLQVKLGVGLLIFALAMPSVSKLFNASITYMFEKVETILGVMLQSKGG